MKITDQAKALLIKFRKYQKVYFLLLALAAMSFVFLRNYVLAAALLLFVFVWETKVFICPHCKKSFDCRRNLSESTCCPHCQKYIFKDLK